MDGPTGMLELLAELLAWVGLSVGALALVIRSIVQVVDGTWIHTHAVLIGDSPDQRVRWIAHDGVIRERGLDRSELDRLGAVDDPEVYYRRRSPDRVRLDAVAHGPRILLLIGLIFLGIGLVAVIASIVLLMIGG